MAKRFGRMLVSEQSANGYAFDARMAGSDHADKAGNCQSPVFIALTGAPSQLLLRNRDWLHPNRMDYADGHGLIGEWSQPRFRHVDMAVRCRKCPACLRARGYHWRMRATAEVALASRTWFGTLTLNPGSHFHCVTQARANLARDGLDWDSLAPSDAFNETLKPLKREFQLYMKRVRKHAVGLRHMLVVERHKSGLAHLHCLIHEGPQPVRHKILQGSWTWGFSSFKLVAELEGKSVAGYVSKYLTKSLDAKVIASRLYGKTI